MMQSQIRAALESHLALFADDQGLLVAWQGVEFEPEVGEEYLRVFVMPAESDSNDLAGAHRVYRGVLQVDVVMQSGRGMGGIEQRAKQIIAHFPKDMRLNTADGFVQLTSVMSIGPVISDGGDSFLPLTSYYRMDTV